MLWLHSFGTVNGNAKLQRWNAISVLILSDPGGGSVLSNLFGERGGTEGTTAHGLLKKLCRLPLLSFER